MATSTPTRNPARLRRCTRQIHRSVRLLALVALLGSPACALAVDPYQIRGNALATATPTAAIADASLPSGNANWFMHGQDEDIEGFDLKRRASTADEKEENDDGDKDDDKDDNKDDNKDNEDDKATITTTHHESSPTKTPSKDHTDDDKEEDDDGKKTESTTHHDKDSTKTTTEDEDAMTTFTMSVDPTSTASSVNSDAPMPSAFDDAISSDYKTSDGDESCPNFMTNLLNSQTFKDCYPLSMIYQTSTQFFYTRRSLTNTVRVLEKSCKADVSTCANFLSTAAKDLKLEENCQSEYNANVSSIIKAYQGLTSYQTFYSATCLRSPDSDQYCFASAVTNSSAAFDYYMYYLPYGNSLPGDSTPTCNWCNKETMAIFHSAASDRSQGVAGTYESAARQINTFCGPNWVNETLPESESGASSLAVSSWPMAVVTVTFAVLISSFI